ncbi:MAG: PQQ-binding-like beta-propeller repeat protein [Ktedonobacteraceae bacterium]
MSFMKNVDSVMPVPCSEWAEKLAATHPDDLSLSERAALNQHLATCAACAAVRDEYRSMDACILELPAVTPLSKYMVQSERLEEAAKERDETFSVTNKPGPVQSRIRLSHVGKTLSSLAAVLVVGVIVGSFVLLFSINRDSATFSGDLAVSSSATIYVATDVAKSVAYAINPVNGAIIWKHMLGYKLTGPATVVHGLVVFASYNGSIYAYHTSNGSFAWKTHVDSSGSAAPSFTPASSSSDIVYFSTMGGNFGALRTSNGSLIWKKHLSTCTLYCDDSGELVDNGVYYVLANGLYALHASTGAVIWQNLDLKVSTSFAVASGKVFVLPSEIVAMPGHNPSNILMLNASNGQQIKTLPGVNFTSGNSVLYVENFDSTWYAMRISDGSILWRSKTAACSVFVGRGVYRGSLSGDTIYSANTISYVSSIGKSGPNVTPTTVQSQSGYSEICAMSTGNGSIRWDLKTSNLEMVTTPVELNDVAYFERNNTLEARRASDGKFIWDVPLPAPSLQGPTIG